ncbi:uncharacterized protein CDAR_621471 [Caerostris darwini]|uniref:Uncharacterized protein n=1 Tax=Caerostris darwini TaxID=1538125 RepID=A0AAV4VDL2_9ARAC|nr:uncharacterized protein CDAR_621471 [Caerostris darwini]
MLQIRKLLLIPVFAFIFHTISPSVETGSASCDVEVSRSCPPRPPSSNRISRPSIPYSLDSFNTFVTIFKEAVCSSQSLSRLFDFDNIPATEFSEKLYQVILEALKTLGAEDQIYAATKAVEPITKNFYSVSSELVIQIYVKFVAKYLFTQDILTPYNTIQLALAYVREMERSAMCYQSQQEALSAGFVNFLTSSGLFTVDSALMVCLEYGNEWKLAAQAWQ